jgi:alpha-beta hydrolase superfamily lysophospholipase
VIKYDEGTLARGTTRGPALYFRATMPDGKPRAAVALVHGYAEHGARYAHVADVWSEKGIATVAIDLRGHGRSDGRRGHCDRFVEFLDDAAELARLMGELVPGVQPVLFGHSFGGLVATSAVIANPGPWRALVLSGPYFGLALAAPPLKVLAGRLASRIVPTLAVPTGLSGKDVTHDADRARAYDEDPLVFKTATARWFTEANSAQSRALARAEALKLPLLLVMGAADHVASVQRARAFFDAAGSRDKTWDEREGLYHEVLSEPSWRPIADRMADWMIAHS